MGHPAAISVSMATPATARVVGREPECNLEWLTTCGNRCSKARSLTPEVRVDVGKGGFLGVDKRMVPE